jgi:hypothetical protein
MDGSVSANSNVPALPLPPLLGRCHRLQFPSQDTRVPRAPLIASTSGHPLVLAKSCRQWTMLDRFVKRDTLIEMLSSLSDFSSKQQGSARETISEHQWGRGTLFLSELQNLRRDIARSVGIECRRAFDKKAEKNREE